MQATLALRFGGEGILKVKGIPFKAGAGDVRKFFSGYKIKPEGVSFIMHADGRPTGMAFIEFETPQEAVRAMVSDAREGRGLLRACAKEMRGCRKEKLTERAGQRGWAVDAFEC
jgi:hypothetical protein